MKLRRFKRFWTSYPEEELKNDKSLLLSWTELAIYVLEMYRIDGRNEEYEALMTRSGKFNLYT